MLSLLRALALAGALLCASTFVRAGTIDRDFKLAAGALIVSSLFDAETSVQAFRNGAHEANPVAAPFVGNRAQTYGYALATDAAILGVTYALKKRGNRYWRALPVAVTIAHVAAGGANLRFVW